MIQAMSEGARQQSAAGRRESILRAGFIALAYSLVHGLTLLNRGIFWDDWVFWRQDKQIVVDAGRQMASTWPAWINDPFYYSVAGITYNRLVAFVAMLLVALIVFDILRRLPSVTESAAMWIAVFVGVFPAFESRVGLVMLGYPLSLLLFAGAAWILVRFAPRPHPELRAIAALMFIGSFRTGSLLVFFAVVPVLLLLVDPPESWKPRAVVGRFLRWSDQLVLPVVFWVATQLWYRPTGRYAGYNMPKSGIGGFLVRMWEGTWNVLTGPVEKAATAIPFTLPLIFAVAAALLALFGVLRWPPLRDRAWVRPFVVGAILILLAVAPYAAVGKAPGNLGWETRHQLLVPFGGACLVYGVATLASRVPRLGRALAAAVLGISLAASAAILTHSYVRYERDWLKQQALMVAFASSPEVERSTFLLLDDRTTDLDQDTRLFYEYTGMLTEVFGDQSRYCVAHVDYTGNYAQASRRMKGEQYYKLEDFEGGKPDLVVVVDRGTLDLRDTREVLRLMLLDWTDREQLRSELRDALVVQTRDALPSEVLWHERHMMVR